jgi:hypothetical protein
VIALAVLAATAAVFAGAWAVVVARVAVTSAAQNAQAVRARKEPSAGPAAAKQGGTAPDDEGDW